MEHNRRGKELERLATLRAYQALDTPPEPCFDRLTRTVAHFLKAPVAFLTLVDEERIFFKSSIGWDMGPVGRESMFYPMQDPFDVLVVSDALQDSRLRTNPFVQGKPHFRFFAGAPLIAPSGDCIGILSAFDFVPHAPLSTEQRNVLKDLADEAMEQIEHRLNRIKLEEYAQAIQQRELEYRQTLARCDKSEARAYLALEAGEMGYWEWDGASGRATWSRRIEQIFGIAPGSYDGSQEMWFERVHPDDRERVMQELTAGIADGLTFSLRYRVVRPDGTVVRVGHRGAYEFKPGGGILAAFGVMWEAGDRERWLAELRASEEFFSGLSRACPVGIFKADLEGNVTYTNPTGRRIWEMGEQEILGLGWMARIHPEDQDRLVSGWLEANRQLSGFELEYRLSMPDGSIRWVHGRSAIFYGTHGPSVVGTVDDITTRVEAARALEAAKAESESANRAKDLFLANVSHELRTPLNGILGINELLLMSDLDVTQREHAEIVQQSGKTLLTLVNDLLDVGKMGAGTLQIEPVPFDLCQTVEAAANYVRAEAQRKGLSLSVACSRDNVPKLIGDANRIQQIVLNFLTNAVKFTDSGGVRCSVRCDRVGAGRYAIGIEVQDSGLGISTAAQAKLFQPFSQVDSSTTRKQRGVGLGLSICRQLAELMGGSVGVSSLSGCGSTFWLRLELEAAAEKTAPDVATAVGDTSLNCVRDRILVAEDNQINQRVVSRMLERLGWEVDIACDGMKAQALATQNKYGLILMDCLMPEADGYTATAMIRGYEETHGLARVPIIALTANALSGDRDRCLEAGMDDYLSKPLQLHLLQEMLERWTSSAVVAV